MFSRHAACIIGSRSSCVILQPISLNIHFFSNSVHFACQLYHIVIRVRTIGSIGFCPSILRQNGIWGAAEKAVLNIVHWNPGQNSILNVFFCKNDIFFAVRPELTIHFSILNVHTSIVFFRYLRYYVLIDRCIMTAPNRPARQLAFINVSL
jgi:hypothetical protein